MRKTVERRLRGFRTLKLDRAEIKASRDFHAQHFLNIAEAAIRNHHREMYYGALVTSVEDVVGHYPKEQLPEELQAAVLKDMAFMEGHLEAFGDVLRAIEELKRKSAETKTSDGDHRPLAAR